MKPIIGISCGLAFDEKDAATSHMSRQFHKLCDSYVAAIEKAGGVPVIIPSYSDPELAKEMVRSLDGILFSGGGDIEPSIFGQRAKSTQGTVEPRRDATELGLAKYVIEETDLPVLGICRGLQVINVAMGGDLIVDLKSVGKEEHATRMYPRYMKTHDVKTIEGTRLCAMMGGTEQRVNSFHHQAAGTAAPGFIVAAVSCPDDVIEALELPGERFVECTQWHPEDLIGFEEHMNIFKSFIKAASEKKN